MDLNYERGSPAEPKGHAILYFRGATEPDRVYATYIVVLPIDLDLVKYMPPFLASQLPQMNAQEVSAFAIPPMPEEAPGREHVESLARVRGDDLLFGGTAEPSRVADLLSQVNDMVQAYAQQYSSTSGAAPAVRAAAPAEATSESSVSEVLYQFMGIQDRLTELARLVGMLRFAVEGTEDRRVQEVQTEIDLLARHLPESYRVGTLVEAARTPTRVSGELAQLYLDRCFKLAAEDYQQLRAIEERIQALESETGPAQP